VLILLTALGHARGTGGDAGAAARLVLNARALHSRVRSKAADRLFGVARLTSRLDARIRHATAEKPAPEVRDAWRVAALLVGEESMAATAVAGSLGLPLDAVERLASAAYLDGLEGAERLSVLHAMPRWLTDRLVEERGLPFADALLGSLNARAPLFVRARGDRDALLAELRKDGVDAHATRYSPWGVELRSHINVRGLAAFKEGRLEVQDEGSQVIALCAAPANGNLVLDVCAGAGGKTLALLAGFPRARVVAMEPGKARLQALKERAQRCGVRVTSVLGGVGDPSTLGYQGKADVVLMDAPCSGTGALRREPESRWRYGADDVAEFARTQTMLLQRAWALLRPGGRLIYATCSMLRQENEDVVAAVLAADPSIKPVALSSLFGETLARDLGAQGHELRLWPHVHGTDGFYMAALRR
jgi:16S rRNA (cytosine967-C5)-methyltransferase